MPRKPVGPRLIRRLVHGVGLRPHLKEDGVDACRFQLVQHDRELRLLLVTYKRAARTWPIEVDDRSNPCPPEFVLESRLSGCGPGEHCSDHKE